MVISAKYFLFRAKWIGDKNLRKLLLTVEFKVDVASCKAFASLLTFRQETLQSIKKKTNSLLSSKLEDC